MEDARRVGHTLGRAGAQRVEQALGDAAEALASSGLSGPLSAGKQALEARIHGLMRGFAAETAQTTTGTVGLTVRRITEIHRDVNVSLAAAVGMPTGPVAAVFNDVPVKALAAMGSIQEQRTGLIYRTLVNHHITDAQPDVDRLIAAGLAQGASVDRVARTWRPSCRASP